MILHIFNVFFLHSAMWVFFRLCGHHAAETCSAQTTDILMSSSYTGWKSLSWISATTSYISLRCSQQGPAHRHTPHQVCQIKSDEIPESQCSSLVGMSSEWLSQHMLAKLFGSPFLDGAISRWQISYKRCVDIPCK